MSYQIIVCSRLFMIVLDNLEVWFACKESCRTKRYTVVLDEQSFVRTPEDGDDTEALSPCPQRKCTSRRLATEGARLECLSSRWINECLDFPMSVRAV